MAAFLEPDGIDAPEVNHAGAAPIAAAAAQRCCKVLEFGNGSTAAVVYVFYRIDGEAAAWLPGNVRPVLRIPGKGWRHAVDFRAGDLVQLADGRIATVEKLVAAPGLDHALGQRAERLRTWLAGSDGTWLRDGDAPSA